MIATDFYQQCEDGLVAQLRTLTTYFPTKNPWQITDDDANLARGAYHFAIYRPGAFPIVGDLLSKKIMDIDWNVTLDLYVRYDTYKEAWPSFRHLRSDIFNLLHGDQTLGDTVNVFRVTFSSDENVQYFKFAETPENAKPNFIIQTTKVVIRQRIRFDK